ncbi:(Fe-S)-binding protein [Haemophilus sputorum]|jgi:Fe-S oxidoreductase|uniref:(Fe-S)-binding protein n=1 Tax=Haemophilus sputorum TaxID=1078480 RepID=A0A369YIT4_9PAST|nr:(Fe-S)-binding protein [Haemophilus sputorum]EJP30961.1 lactate utilization protein A [Haemophilus sputorum HK 2154]MCQ1857998.1 (Fe-S)-binding protein [Haemophilus sputorum]RDE70309.1 (Fe-S)-binding protein [Haemophilus sputorum]RDF07443.1 (Fe-S)-binding protein [Haemophilus sputorum]RDF11126.1 (Fe-S)-binding protein [Haemophilus sputorum]
MNVNFYVTCIADIAKSNVAKNSVLLLEKLGCNVIFLEKQGCCGQPAINSGYAKEAVAGMKSLVETFEVNDYPIVAPAGSCVYAIKNYPEYFTRFGEPEWAKRAEKVAARFCDLTDFIVNKLGKTDVGARLKGKAVYHPSCSLTRKLGVVDEPLALLKNVKGLELMPIHNQNTCCGFGGTFSVKMAEISGEMVTEKVVNISEVDPDYLVGADVSCLLNIAGRLSREGKNVKVMHIAEVLMQEEGEA